MSDYTAQIQASNADGTLWQAVSPAETILGAQGDAGQVARGVAVDQIAVDSGTWRVVVWPGADADLDTEPAFVYTPTG